MSNIFINSTSLGKSARKLVNISVSGIWQMDQRIWKTTQPMVQAKVQTKRETSEKENGD